MDDYNELRNKMLLRDNNTLAINEIESMDLVPMSLAFGYLHDFDKTMAATIPNGVIYISSSTGYPMIPCDDGIFGIDRGKQDLLESGLESLDRKNDSRPEISVEIKSSKWDKLKHLFHFRSTTDSCNLCIVVIGIDKEPNPEWESYIIKAYGNKELNEMNKNEELN